ncbi:MAG: type II toxin-antitoxin system RelE/ParE family toxin, partial [Neisseriaceae bacterium]|nr:type II toxin-antitoxin system RelE/ParE family toxin [Neisseriaceae bacterium]
MQELRWSSKAQSDLLRLYEFLHPINSKAAKNTLKTLSNKAEFLCE